ncbi:MAG: DNA repair protein RadA [bacterium]
MAKNKIHYECSNCGQSSLRWIGCCPSCSEWNSFVEHIEQPEGSLLTGTLSSKNTGTAPVNLLLFSQIQTESQERMLSGIKEWDRVLGGGILPGSFTILSGDPGIGKSTLLLQIADKIAQNHNVIYFSSEESLNQIKNRANRLNTADSKLLLSDQACLQNIIQISVEKKPDLVILDSIQNCYISLDSSTIPGTIGQLREAGFHLMRLAKEHNIAILITGHVTKDGNLAGPKVLEHIVDAVFYLQAEDRWQTRILRSVKNRFGAINEVGFFQMCEQGLEEVSNINKQLLEETTYTPGAVLVCSIEGIRPILLELQALCITSKLGFAQRVVTGVDPKRVVLIAAILEKYLHVQLSNQDIFFKVSGGLKIKDSLSDLGIALALLSSYFQKPLPQKSVALAEISLTGQIKPINQIDTCIKEVEKFGLENILIAQKQKVKSSCSKLLTFSNVYELLRLFPETGN